VYGMNFTPLRRVSSMDSSATPRLAGEVGLEGKQSSALEAMLSATNEKLRHLQVAFDELAGGSGRLDLAEVQIERLTEAFEKKSWGDGQPGEGAASASPTASQLLQCQRMAREAEEVAEKASREAERLSLQVRQALSQTDEQKARTMMLIERITSNEQQVRSISARAIISSTVGEASPMDVRELQQADDRPRSIPHGLETEVEEIKYELERHWKGVTEVKRAVELVNEKFTRDLKTVKEAQRTLHQMDSYREGQCEDIEGNGKTNLIQEVQALRDCIARGEVALQRLAPKLLEAACSGKDLKLIQSARMLQAATNPLRYSDAVMQDCDEEDDIRAQSPAASREYPRSPAGTQGGMQRSCFSGCFRGMR